MAQACGCNKSVVQYGFSRLRAAISLAAHFFGTNAMHKSYKSMSFLLQLWPRPFAWLLTLLLCSIQCVAAEAPKTKSAKLEAKTEVKAEVKAGEVSSYLVQPGDVLMISVWKEPDLQAEVLVRPDGGLSFPLVGDLKAENRSVEELQAQLGDKLKKYIPDPVVTVVVKVTGGNRIYVVGKVNRPGEYPLYRPLDVMQALSLAGGTTPFAALNDIEILRREGTAQRAISFRYGDVEKGRALEQNFLLKSGDTIVVP
jgi:polysaccharide biosynthesis/export protein